MTDAENQVQKLSQQPIVEQMATQIGVDGMMLLHTIQSMLPKGTSFATLMTCVSVASDLCLNPMTKQIYFMPTKGGAIQPIVSVDGWIAMANRHADFNGWGQFTPTFAEDGNTIVLMTGTMYHKTREHPTIITEYFEECAKGGGPVWKSHPMRMMRNRTISQLVRVALGISGIMLPDEFQQWQANPELQAEPIDITPSDPRDGSQIDFRGEARKRPASGAFKDVGGQDKFNALTEELEGAETVEDLTKCYDAFCLDGTPWAAFPQGWARLLQETYHYRIKALNEASREPELAPIDAIEAALQSAATKEHLGEMFRGNFENGEPWGLLPEDQREDIQAIYDARMSEIQEVAA